MNKKRIGKMPSNNVFLILGFLAIILFALAPDISHTPTPHDTYIPEPIPLVFKNSSLWYVSSSSVRDPYNHYEGLHVKIYIKENQSVEFIDEFDMLVGNQVPQRIWWNSQKCYSGVIWFGNFAERKVDAWMGLNETDEDEKMSTLLPIHLETQYCMIEFY